MDARPWTRPYRLLTLALVALMTAGAMALPALAQEAEQVETPEQAEPAVREGQWIDFTFGTGIEPESREVIGAGETFDPETEKIYCFTRVHGLRPPAAVTHVWYHEGRTISRVDLNVGSENWRTWSYKSRFEGWSGAWEVKVLNEDGMVLGSATFTVR